MDAGNRAENGLLIFELPDSAQFSLDANCFITPWRRTYPPDLFPPVWDHLAKLIDDGVVVSNGAVLRELRKKDDEVVAWCEKREDVFLELIESLQEGATAIEAKYPKLLKGNRNEGDPFVIATAQLKAPSLLVVTEENPIGANENRPNIPFICDEEGVNCCTFVEMLRNTGFKVYGI